MAGDQKKPCDVSSLMSPPEAVPFDSFSQVTMANANQSSGPEKRHVPNPPLSPPISPFAKAANTASVSPGPDLSIAVKDPILYPSAEAVVSLPTGPLFNPTTESIRTAMLVDEHIASRPATLFRESTPPQREDYELALYFKSNCLKMFRQNPREWLRQERELLRADRKLQTSLRPPVRLHAILPASKSAGPRTQPAKPSPNRVQKPKASSPKAKAQAARPVRAAATPARHIIRFSDTPELRVRTVAPNREDKDFNSLEDLCPPLNSLPTSKSGSLKVDWKGNALDLSEDPHRHLLHPDEITLAANLRLDCATYLTNKRRIFLRRRECAQIGKEFRKTDAQQACKIDVNKASKLWQAYEKVGWLSMKWVQPHMS
ncbi:hypothetical protein B0H63DRAFT_401695 [Podospora didyma]|uniref:SWIRM domain-containing protein n=1 Tax=Podospora didyma TaxID=330526 RepID=A0AAE0K8P7_9PEZI|nr:hypothetical protein B0H63DRAFT_401695 [Podospora didyma]